MNEGALATLNIEQSLAEIASGILSKTIAARYGVIPFAIRKKLAKADPEGYKQAILDQAESLVEQATDYAMNCDAATVAIARVRLDAAHKWAQARNPAWSPRQVLAGDPGAPLLSFDPDPHQALIEAARTVAFILAAGVATGIVIDQEHVQQSGSLEQVQAEDENTP